MIKTNLHTAIKIHNSKKTFFLYTLNHNNELIDFSLTDDLRRHRNKFQSFKLVQVLKRQNKTITF